MLKRIQKQTTRTAKKARLDDELGEAPTFHDSESDSDDSEGPSDLEDDESDSQEDGDEEEDEEKIVFEPKGQADADDEEVDIDASQDEGSGSESESDSGSGSGDPTIFSCKACPDKVLKNETMVSVHLESKEHKRRVKEYNRANRTSTDIERLKAKNASKKQKGLAKKKERLEAKKLAKKEKFKAKMQSDASSHT